MKLTFKQEEQIIKKYASDYKKSKIIETMGVDIISENNIPYIDNINKYHYYYALQEKIDIVLEKLDWESCYFLKNEFFSNNYRQDWWMKFYSRSTYYRKKGDAMKKFLGLLHD